MSHAENLVLAHEVEHLAHTKRFQSETRARGSAGIHFTLYSVVATCMFFNPPRPFKVASIMGLATVSLLTTPREFDTYANHCKGQESRVTEIMRSASSVECKEMELRMMRHHLLSNELGWWG